MNIYSVIAVVLGVFGAAHAKATATIGGAHLTVPLLGLLTVAVILALAVIALWLVRLIASDGGFWLAARPAGAP
jgi:hypothetical protein